MVWGSTPDDADTLVESWEADADADPSALFSSGSTAVGSTPDGIVFADSLVVGFGADTDADDLPSGGTAWRSTRDDSDTLV